MILRFLKTDEAIQDGVVLPSAEWQEAVNRFNLNLILVLAGIHEEMGTLELLEIQMHQRVQDPLRFEDADAVVVIRGQDETKLYVAPETLFGRILSCFKQAIEKIEFQREKAINFKGVSGSSQNQRRFLTLWLMGEQPPEPSDAEFTGRKPRNPNELPLWYYQSDFPGKKPRETSGILTLEADLTEVLFLTPLFIEATTSDVSWIFAEKQRPALSRHWLV